MRLGQYTVCALALVGCTRPSMSPDVARVRELTGVQRLAAVADVEVDPVASEEAHRMLGEPLTADAAVRVALLNNRELRATLRELGVARGRLMQAGVLPNPTVEVELQPERNSRFELRVEYDLTSAILAPRRARAAAPELTAARFHAAGAVVALGYHVRVAFYRVQASEQQLALAQRMLDTHAAGRDAARAMYAAGNVPELNVASMEVAYERARITVAELELAVASAREALHRLLGAHGADTAWELTGELPPVPEATSIPTAVEQDVIEASLDLRETRERLEGLARRAGVARTAGWLPDIAVDLHALNGNPEDDPMGSSGWRFGGGVSVGVPLFDQQRGTTRALQAEFDALLERFYGQAVDLRSAAREARNRVTSAHARARQYQTVIVPGQARVTQQTLLQYNAMQVGIYHLLQARREELEAQLAHVETLREYWSATAELTALLAGKQVEGAPRGASTMSSGASGAAEGH
ncbi:MAG: TolC family protein [Polyangiales bacterium]